MENIRKKVKEEGILKKIQSMIAIPMNIEEILTEEGISSKVEKKITKKDYPNLYKIKKSPFYEDFSFFISDMKRLPYYEGKMIDLNIFLSSLEKLASNEKLYEYGTIPDSIASDEETMLKTFKKYGFKPYNKKGGSKNKNKKVIKKQKGGNNKKLTKIELENFIKKINIEEYEGDADDDYSFDLYDDLVENEKAYYLCRKKIDKGYINEVFNNKKGKGFIATTKKGDYIGFIIFFEKNKSLYLDLVCTIKNKYTKGLPLGQIFLYKMEKYAKENNYNKMTGDSVKPALEFYKSLGWKQKSVGKDGKIKIEKKINKSKSIKNKNKKIKKKSYNILEMLKSLFIIKK